MYPYWLRTRFRTARSLPSRLDARARDIVAFALNHRSGESAAVVTMVQRSSEAAEEAATDPRTDIAFTIRADAQRTYAEDVDVDPSRVKLVQ